MSTHMVATLIDRRLRRLFPRVSVEILKGPESWFESDRIQIRLAPHVQPAKLFEYTCVLPPRDLHDDLSEPYAAQIVYEVLKELSVCKPSL